MAAKHSNGKDVTARVKRDPGHHEEAKSFATSASSSCTCTLQSRQTIGIELSSWRVQV